MKIPPARSRRELCATINASTVLIIGSKIVARERERERERERVFIVVILNI